MENNYKALTAHSLPSAYNSASVMTTQFSKHKLLTELACLHHQKMAAKSFLPKLKNGWFNALDNLDSSSSKILANGPIICEL